MRLLKYLMENPAVVITRQELLEAVWPHSEEIELRTVDVHVRRLRAKLGAEHEHHIGTVRNVGYRFVLPSKDSEAKKDAGLSQNRQDA